MGISGSWACCGFLLYLLALFLTPFRTIGTALPRGSLSPNSSTSWSTSFSAPNNTVKFDDGSIARSILVSENVTVYSEPNGNIEIEYACGCGFFCNPPCNSFLFATFVLYYYKYDSGTSVATDLGPHVVWSANPKNPVNANATLQFTSKGGLVLRANGTEAWSAKITNKYVASLNLTPTCNLMLLDKNDETIWQSYEHPMDTLFRGQQLLFGVLHHLSISSPPARLIFNVTATEARCHRLTSRPKPQINLRPTPPSDLDPRCRSASNPLLFRLSTSDSMGISGSWACCGFLLYLLALFLTPFRTIGTALPRGSLSPNSSTSWSTSFSAPNNTVKFDDGSIARSILVSENVKVSEPYGDIEYACGCGFFCNPPCNSFLFATFVLYYYKYDSGTSVATDLGPHVVWSANPKNPVNANATLQFTSKGGLVLRANGTEAWSAKITNKYVASLNLTPTCNLMLLDKNDETIWQSYEHPTDTLFRGQQLLVGKSLTSKEGLFSLNITREGIFAYINSNPPQLYYSYNISGSDTNISGIEFRNGSIVLLDSKMIPQEIELPGRSARFARYARFEDDGHLRVYTFRPKARDDILLATQLYSCDFPTACGNYGVCENKGESYSWKQCTCLPDKNKNGTSYFKAIDETEPDKGCTPVTNLSCEGEALDRHTFLEVKNITNFRFSAQDPYDIKPDHRSIRSEKCKEECQKRNCSCKAAIYYYKSGSSTGDCYLESQIFSMMKPIPEELQYPSMLFKIWIKCTQQRHGLILLYFSSCHSKLISPLHLIPCTKVSLWHGTRPLLLKAEFSNRVSSHLSFEEQTNTLLPEAKIGYNRLPNKSNILRSWTSSENPGTEASQLCDIDVFVATMASVISIRYLFVIAQKDLNQGGQEIGEYKTT
ncbi:hypothetical protein CMV_018094 [Castanea mollissima]|uniref:Bulb-type lectin domain-containing protein n=1 Tax=Castanea mollissima TaxID=60419 RepID=A0A8J4R1Q5_9ROSI|nr:hypothetical protein CMV_018094 [Castanea mollissima]